MKSTFLRNLLGWIDKAAPLDFILRFCFLHLYLIHQLKVKKPSSRGGAPKKILVINHCFDQDILCLSRVNKVFEIREIHPGKTFHVAKFFFNEIMQTGDVDYHSAETQRARARFRKVMRYILKFLLKLYRCDLVLVPSDAYYWFREAIPLLHSWGIPTICYFKEGIKTPFWFDYDQETVLKTWPFICDHLLVWSEQQKEYWKTSGVEATAIEVVGHARTDFFKNQSFWKTKVDLGLSAEKPIILFFSYEVFLNLPLAFFQKEPQKNWGDMRNDSHEVMIDLAKKYPNYNFIVKVHPQQTDQFELRDFFNQQNLSNLFILGGAALAGDLIVNADVVVGFDSTALVETLLTDKPVVYTFWGEATRYDAKHWFHPRFVDCAEVSTARSKEDLLAILTTFIENPNARPKSSLAERQKFVQHYFFQADGQVSERVITACEKFLSKWVENPQQFRSRYCAQPFDIK